MAGETKKPNLFVALELDPGQRWDQAAFESRLTEKQSQWSKDSMRPDKRGMAAKLNLAQLSAFRRIAEDPEAREAEARAAREERKAAQAGLLEELRLRLQLLEVRGFILEEEFRGLVKDFANGMTEAQIRKEIKVPIKSAAGDKSAAQAGVNPLDPTIGKRIRQLLDNLDQPNLYVFLGLTPAAGSQQLRERADQERIAMLRKAAKSAELTVRQELAGICLKVFESDIEKGRYDETLRRERIQKVAAAVDQVAGISRQIVQAQIDELLARAQAWGVQPNEAHAAILEHARTKGYAITLKESGDVPRRLQRCGACGRLNEADNSNCTGCGQSLHAPCPKCKKQVPSDEQACGNCGFPSGNRAFVRLMFNEADAAVTSRDYLAAGSMIAQARNAWPAPPDDTLGREIEKLNQQIAPVLDKIKQAREGLDAAISAREFYAARRLLGDLAKLLPAGDDSLGSERSSVDAAIQETEALLATARQVKANQPDAAIAALEDALRHSADCQDAADLLAKMPPGPPTNLQATVHGQVVQLTWQPSTSAGVSHVIVRKARTRPTSGGDGTRVASTHGATYDDDAPEIGVPLFYAVYANRGGVLSAAPAMLAYPAMVIVEAGSPSVTVGSGTIQLAWQMPANAFDVRIVRSEQAYPAAENNGQPVMSVSTNLAVDRGLINGRRYYYTLWTRYKDQDGRLVVSEGLHLDAIPEEPPLPLGQLKITAVSAEGGRTLAVELPRPAKGEVAILHTRQPAGLQPGGVLGQREFAGRGQVLTGTSLQVPVDGPGVHYFTPAVIYQQMAYLGAEQRYVHAEDVTDLKAQNLGFALRLQWRWPNGCDEVVVAWCSAGWPDPSAAGVATRPLTRAQYEQTGRFDIPNPGSSDLYITVFAITRHNGERILAAGQSPSARKRVTLGSRITLDYAIKKARFGGALSLEVEKQGARPWPGLLLVCKQGGLPLNSADGEVILRVEAGRADGNRQAVAISREATRPQAYARLFLEDTELYDCVVIRDPERDKLRLF